MLVTVHKWLVGLTSTYTQPQLLVGSIASEGDRNFSDRPLGRSAFSDRLGRRSVGFSIINDQSPFGAISQNRSPRGQSVGFGFGINGQPPFGAISQVCFSINGWFTTTRRAGRSQLPQVIGFSGLDPAQAQKPGLGGTRQAP